METKLKQQTKTRSNKQSTNKQQVQGLIQQVKDTSASAEEQPEEGLYKLVKQDEQLNAYHVAKLLETPGYSRLTTAEAEDIVAQMLQLSCLLHELVAEEAK
ncbi:hypothetical protein ACMA1I_19295 [Pontibacter sp. 13R65]|uniref:hypothetical protein n=1 Tax=Pontibacter sp. 13R65 TaxID=3127458 RepID=UPI00301D9CA6